MKTGLFFGSFNPIHNGHLMLANYIVEYTDIDKILLIISPQNPHKELKTLLEDKYRYELALRAVSDFEKIEISRVEFSMPKPSYTINTLTYLWNKYPDKKFVLIMGEDSLTTLDKWKNYEQILKKCEIYVYPRPDTEKTEMHNRKNVKIIKAPKIEISSTFIRKAVKEKKDISFFMPKAAYNYMKEMHFFE